MSDFWPQHLVRELADRRGIVFLGAGSAMTCVTTGGEPPPGWAELLEKLAVGLHTEARSEFERSMRRERLLDAAQVIIDNLEFPVLQSRFHDLFNNPKVAPGRLYELVSLLDQQVVMTTNYDRIYERYWETLLGSTDAERPPLVAIPHHGDGLIDNLRSERRLLLKLHGTVTEANKIVLSRSQYARARYDYPLFFRGVSALLLTRTVLFIGSGFSGDPDIDLLLEDTAFAAQSLCSHYAIVPSGKSPSEVKSIKSAFNVHLLEYDVDSSSGHGQLIERLEELVELVQGARGE